MAMTVGSLHGNDRGLCRVMVGSALYRMEERLSLGNDSGGFAWQCRVGACVAVA